MSGFHCLHVLRRWNALVRSSSLGSCACPLIIDACWHLCLAHPHRHSSRLWHWLWPAAGARCACHSAAGSQFGVQLRPGRWGVQHERAWLRGGAGDEVRGAPAQVLWVRQAAQAMAVWRRPCSLHHLLNQHVHVLVMCRFLAPGCRAACSPTQSTAARGFATHKHAWRTRYHYNFVQPVDTNQISLALRQAHLLPQVALVVLQHGQWFDPEQVTRTLRRLPAMIARHNRASTPGAGGHGIGMGRRTRCP